MLRFCKRSGELMANRAEEGKPVCTKKAFERTRTPCKTETWGRNSASLNFSSCAAAHCYPQSGEVGATGFEPATPWSQTRCATNCATPRGNCFSVCKGRKNYRGGQIVIRILWLWPVECAKQRSWGRRVRGSWRAKCRYSRAVQWAN